MKAVRRPLLFALLPTLAFLLACSGGDDASGAAEQATASPTTEAANRAEPTATPTPPPQIEADGARIFERVRVLSETIGARPAGTSKEQEAIDYISGELRGFGYEVELQEFSIATESGRASSLGVRTPERRTIPTVPFAFSGSGAVRGPLIFAGLGAAGDFPVDAPGGIALIERDDLLFVDKVANAAAAGTLGVIIFNNERGTFFGSLERGATIPVVSISQAEGEALRAQLQAATFEVDLEVSAAGDSVAFNIIARPPGRECETVSGGHYDSVPQAPGASDNATGTATVIEIAALLASNGGMGANCFVLFGAEELGLIGSRAYVASLTSSERAGLRAMLNFDMVGVGDDTWLLIGTAALQQRGAELAGALGIDTDRGQLQSNTSSDHASFLAAGVPSLMLHRLNDPLLHTPQDVLDRVRPELLEQAARLGVALLQSLSET